MTQPAIKPSQFDTKQWFMDTVWQNSETETVARNIVIISRENGDSWDPFTWEEYCRRCKHNPAWQEKSVLDALVQRGYLGKSDGRYSVNDRFIEALADFVKK